MNKNTADSRLLGAFFHDMSAMIASGLDMEEIAATLARDCGDESFRAVLSALRDGVASGESLSAAMRETGGFPAYAVHMTEAAEAGGRMEQVTEALGGYFDRRERMRQLINTALAQPLILLLLLTLVLGGLMALVLPAISGVYTALGGDASLYIAFSYIIGWVALAVTALALLLALAIWLRAKSGRETPGLSRLWERSALTEDAALLYAQASFTADLEVRVSGGLLTDASFQRAAENISAPLLRERALSCAERINRGESMGLVLLEERLLPPVCTHILYGAGTSGQLEKSLQRVRERLFQDAEERTELMIKRIEPALTGVFTLAVALSLLSAMLPLIGVISAMG